jgi:hypothetical protein
VGCMEFTIPGCLLLLAAAGMPGNKRLTDPKR